MTSLLSYASNLLDQADEFANKDKIGGNNEHDDTIQTISTNLKGTSNEIAPEEQNKDTEAASATTIGNSSEISMPNKTLPKANISTTMAAVPKPKPVKAKAKPSKRKSNSSIQEQYEGVLKLWNEERKTAKAAQDTVRRLQDRLQKMNDKTKAEKTLLVAAHQREMKALEKDLQDTLLLKIAQKDKISELEKQISNNFLNEQSISLQHSKTLEILRNSFEKERQEWIKEKQVLIENAENRNSNSLANENKQYINALARNQSNLQQSQMENSRLISEIKWLKCEAENVKKQLALNQNEKDAMHESVTNVNKENNILREKLEKAEHRIAQFQTEIDRKIKQEKEREEQNRIAIQNRSRVEEKMQKAKNDGNDADKRKIQALTNKLLSQQSDLDIAICQRNQIQNKYASLESKYQSLILQNQISSNNQNQLTININNPNRATDQALNNSRNQFDRLALMMNRYFRTYPALRVFFLVYIVVLHIFVYIILHLHT